DDALSRVDNLAVSVFNDTLQGDSGTNGLAGGAGIDTVTYEHALAAVTVNLALTTPRDTRGCGIDTLEGLENLPGSAFNDPLLGTAGDNVLIGLGGNDTLNG